MMVSVVLNGMYICCNVLNYFIYSYDSRDVHIVLEHRKIMTFVIKGNGCQSVIIHPIVKLVCNHVHIYSTD